MGVVPWAKDIVAGFITVLVGMRLTLRQMFQPPVTLHYPDQKWVMPPNFRGLIKCDQDACIVCDLCAKACPVECIDIGWKREEGKSGKVLTRFAVDFNKCLYCGLCVDPCPTNAIWHSHEYENSSEHKEDMIMDYVLPRYTVKNPNAKAPKSAAAKPAAPKPAAAQAHAPAAGATATAVAAPTTGGKVGNVWIIEGCIVCDLCEDTCPEVFKVNDTTSIVLEEDKPRWGELSGKIIEAAQACPVNVIKYE